MGSSTEAMLQRWSAPTQTPSGLTSHPSAPTSPPQGSTSAPEGRSTDIYDKYLHFKADPEEISKFKAYRQEAEDFRTSTLKGYKGEPGEALRKTRCWMAYISGGKLAWETDTSGEPSPGKKQSIARTREKAAVSKSKVTYCAEEYIINKSKKFTHRKLLFAFAASAESPRGKPACPGCRTLLASNHIIDLIDFNRRIHWRNETKKEESSAKSVRKIVTTGGGMRGERG